MQASSVNLLPPVWAGECDSNGPPPELHIYLRPQATLLRIQEAAWHPPTDVFETEETYQVKVELGGMEREGISVTVEDRILLIRGRRCDSSPPNKIRYRQAEIKYGAFEVRLALPDDVDFDGISAVYGNGFLDAVLPKRPSTGLQSTRVTIQIG